MPCRRRLRLRSRRLRRRPRPRRGLPHFVAARVVLLCLGGHAVPIDERLCGLLGAEEAIQSGATADEASSWLEHQLHAGEAGPAYALLEAWAAGQPLPKAPRKPAK